MPDDKTLDEWLDEYYRLDELANQALGKILSSVHSSAYTMRKQARNKALEDAAKVCEDRVGTAGMFSCRTDLRTHDAAVRGCAAAIRELI